MCVNKNVDLRERLREITQMEHLVGYLIAAAGTLAIVFWPGFIIYKWRQRWGVEPLAGVLVRTTGILQTEVDWEDLKLAIEAARWTLDDEFMEKSESIEWRVEVCPEGGIVTPTIPNGKMPDGSGVGGSVRSERCLPWTTKHLVVVVTANRPGDYLLHEVIRHVASQALYGSIDRRHTSELLHQTTQRARKALSGFRTRKD